MILNNNNNNNNFPISQAPPHHLGTPLIDPLQFFSISFEPGGSEQWSSEQDTFSKGDIPSAK